MYSCSMRAKGPGKSTWGSPEPLYEPSMISEAKLVRLVINALQGVRSALACIEKISALYRASPSDRTSLSISNLWHRSSSTLAMGKALESVGCSGLVYFLLHQFSDFFLTQMPVKNGEGSRDETSSCPFTLVNQAFATGLKKILMQYLSALNTLNSSIQLRYSANSVNEPELISSEGDILSAVHHRISLLELLLHTKELQIQILALGNICRFKNVGVLSAVDKMIAEEASRFQNFYRGGNLLTYLYAQLRDADPSHHAVLKFLFIQSCEPYFAFIKSWIYHASINDPYKEFIEGCQGYSLSSVIDTCTNNDFMSPSSKDGIDVPCFLKDAFPAMLRTGLQLQVLIKFFEMCFHKIGEAHINDRDTCLPSSLPGLEDVLPFWGESSNRRVPSLVFSKRGMEALKLERQRMYLLMNEKLENLLPRLIIKLLQKTTNDVMLSCLSERVMLDDSLLFPKASVRAPKIFFAEDGECDTAHLSDDISVISEEGQLLRSSFSYINDENISSKQQTELRDSLFDLMPDKIQNCMQSAHYAEQRTLASVSHVAPICIPGGAYRETDSVPESHFSGAYREMDSMSENYFSGAPKEMDSVPESYLSGVSSQFSMLKTPGIKSSYRSDQFWLNKWFLQIAFAGDGSSIRYPQVQLDNSSQHLPLIQSFGPDLKCSDILVECENFDTCTEGLLSDNRFSANPMLIKKSRFPMRHNTRNAIPFSDQKLPFSYFDFTSVVDPCNMNDTLSANFSPEFQSTHPLCEGAPNASDGDKNFSNLCSEIVDLHSGGNNSLLSSTNPVVYQQGPFSELNFTGCFNWENLLSYGSKNIFVSKVNRHAPLDVFEAPVDVVIDQCIVQEILLQYTYISHLTLKLLDDGFDLRGHLLSLRRYHFMELADWADTFIQSIWHRKWYMLDTSQRMSEIQGFFDAAIQKSSCEGDNYKERLFVYDKGECSLSLPSSSSGIHALDFITLGYRVGWPVNIILTPDTLKVYERIFNFLMQVKVALFSLTDLWCSCKGLMHHSFDVDVKKMKYFNLLMRLRQQVNHFVSTLHVYMHLELSSMAWCQFLHSLNNQVKDIMDLKCAHSVYLNDSLNICFMSAEAKPIASVIEGILECAVDFHSCFIDGVREKSDENGTTEMLLLTNFSQIMRIKSRFEGLLKELHHCYLWSPKQSMYGLAVLWEYLDHNEFYLRGICGY